MTINLNRRTFLITAAAAGLGSALPLPGAATESPSTLRRYNVSLAADAIERDPELLSIVKKAGVETVWVAGFFYGHWTYSIESLLAARKRIEAAGMVAHLVNVPLGHPGDSLGSTDNNFPLTPSSNWRMAQRVDGSRFSGTSLHEPATADNVAAIQKLHGAGFSRIFLDDDFRLSPSPGQIGGCFCADHRDRYLKRTGYTKPQWDELLGDVKERRLTRLLRDWIEMTCDELTGSFRSQQKALDGGELGIMVMYFGSEKAGIRLADYADVPFRVGELMFDDASFAPVKGKTNELFSVLFHRRFASPERAFSESTAYPSDKLSARNMAAKLAISTIADVRNTMFMSGITPFPRTHWETLGPAMKIQAAHHQKLAGHVPRGPFKHYWGEYSRMIGDDAPFSLFLASGVPFETTDKPAQDGWTFLSDFDARAVADGQLKTNGTTFVYRPSVKGSLPNGEPMEETLDALFAMKERIKPQLKNTPYVEENVPVVCAWYPSAKTALLWNLSEEEKSLTLVYKNARRPATVPGLSTALVEGLFESS